MKSEKKMILAARIDPVSLIHLGHVIEQLRAAHPRCNFTDFRDIPEGGNRRAKGLGSMIGMLERKEVDVVVAGASELPLRLQSGVTIAAVPDRGNPFDVLIARDELILDEQPEHVRLAVTDWVSKVQLLYYRPDLIIRQEKSGIDTLNKLMEDREIDGFVTAAMEIEALNQQDRVVEVFTSSICTPAAGQGAIVILTRKNDRRVHSAVDVLNDPSSMAEVELERMFLGVVCKDSKVPVGVLAKMEGDTFEIEAAITAPDGSEKVSGALDGVVGQEREVIEKLADDLIASGGNRIINVHK